MGSGGGGGTLKSKSTPTKRSVVAVHPNDENEQQTAKDLFGFGDTHCHCCGVSNTDIGGFLLQCATCKVAYYCGIDCFNQHLPTHLQFCRTNALTRAPQRPQANNTNTSTSTNSTNNNTNHVPPNFTATNKTTNDAQRRPTKQTYNDLCSSDDDDDEKKTVMHAVTRRPPATRTKRVAAPHAKRTFNDGSCTESDTESESGPTPRRRRDDQDRTVQFNAAQKRVRARKRGTKAQPQPQLTLPPNNIHDDPSTATQTIPATTAAPELVQEESEPVYENENGDGSNNVNGNTANAKKPFVKRSFRAGNCSESDTTDDCHLSSSRSQRRSNCRTNDPAAAADESDSDSGTDASRQRPLRRRASLSRNTPSPTTAGALVESVEPQTEPTGSTYPPVEMKSRVKRSHTDGICSESESEPECVPVRSEVDTSAIDNSISVATVEPNHDVEVNAAVSPVQTDSLAPYEIVTVPSPHPVDADQWETGAIDNNASFAFVEPNIGVEANATPSPVKTDSFAPEEATALPSPHLADSDDWETETESEPDETESSCVEVWESESDLNAGDSGGVGDGSEGFHPEEKDSDDFTEVSVDEESMVEESIDEESVYTPSYDGSSWATQSGIFEFNSGNVNCRYIPEGPPDGPAKKPSRAMYDSDDADPYNAQRRACNAVKPTRTTSASTSLDDNDDWSDDAKSDEDHDEETTCRRVGGGYLGGDRSTIHETKSGDSRPNLRNHSKTSLRAARPDTIHEQHDDDENIGVEDPPIDANSQYGEVTTVTGDIECTRHFDDDDENVEETRTRVGGGTLVRVEADIAGNATNPFLNRSESSSRILKPAVRSVSNTDWEKPEWTEAQLRATMGRDELTRIGSAAITEWEKPEWTGAKLRTTSLRGGLLAKGTLSPKSVHQHVPDWIRERLLRSTDKSSCRGVARNKSRERLIGPHDSVCLRPTTKGELLRRGQSIRTVLKEPESADGLPLSANASIASSLTSNLEEKQPSVQGISSAPKFTKQKSVRVIRLKKQKSVARGIRRTNSSDSKSRDGSHDGSRSVRSGGLKKGGKKVPGDISANTLVTMTRQGSVRVGLGSDAMMLNVVKVEVFDSMQQPKMNRRVLRTTSKGKRLMKGESIRKSKSSLMFLDEAVLGPIAGCTQ